jgi:hypothetical protein
VGLAITVGVGCCVAVPLEIPLVTGGCILELPGMFLVIDVGVVATVTTGEVVGTNTGVTVIMAGGTFVTLVPVPVVAFCMLLEKRKYQ